MHLLNSARANQYIYKLNIIRLFMYVFKQPCWPILVPICFWTFYSFMIEFFRKTYTYDNFFKGQNGVMSDISIYIMYRRKFFVAYPYFLKNRVLKIVFIYHAFIILINLRFNTWDLLVLGERVLHIIIIHTPPLIYPPYK